MISIGHPIPDVCCEARLPDGRIEPASRAHYRGKWLVQFFWPSGFTLDCPTENRTYSDLSHASGASGAVLVGARVDSAHAHQALVNHGLGAVRFPIPGDVPRALAQGFQGFGVLAKPNVAMRATFIVHPEGRALSVAANDLNAGSWARETLHLLHTLQREKLTTCEWQSGESFAMAA